MSLITTREKNFAKWYEDIIVQTDLALHGLVKGTILFGPKATFIWEQIQKHINESFKKLSIQNVMFPALIPSVELEKEKADLTGFVPELFNIIPSTSKDNKVSMFLRPTSEILFSYYFRTNLESHTDLPICLNQWCSVYRSEKNTKLFLRSCEFYWQEAHTIHLDQEDADKYLAHFHQSYQHMITNLLSIAYIQGEKTIGERFVGAVKTMTVESIMPDGQVLQMATSHDLSQNFAKTFEIKYASKNNTREHPFQLSAGCSTRLMGALIMSHSDDLGLVLPWKLNPIKVKVLVINGCVAKEDSLYSQINDQIKDYDHEWDFSNDSFGKKIADSELYGIPAVLVIGKKELAEGKVMLKIRTSSEKIQLDVTQIKNELSKVHSTYDAQLLSKSKQHLDSSIVEANTLEEVTSAIANKKVVLVPWFDDANNEETFKATNLGFTPRCIKERLSNSQLKCFFSGKPANCLAYFGRSY